MRRVAVIGGGIAGLATAWHLARARAGSVVLLERESLLASHSSARNAAIFQLLEELPGMLALAVRTRAHLDALLGRGDDGWLRRTGELFVAPAEAPGSGTRGSSGPTSSRASPSWPAAPRAAGSSSTRPA